MNNISIEKCGESARYEIQLRTDLGGRADQQDSAYVYTGDDLVFALVCDGMGGTENGALASRIAVSSGRALLLEYLKNQKDKNIPQFLIDAFVDLDAIVSQELGKRKGGTTAVAAFLEGDQLYWFSSGDSRLYIFRGGDLVQATRDHNYFLRLNEQLQKGEINEQEYERESARGEALISYLGVGGLPVFDLTSTPLELMDGDILLLTTDGLYKALPESLIAHVMSSSGSVVKMADKLMSQIQVLKSTVVLDNTTFALIQITTKGDSQ